MEGSTLFFARVVQIFSHKIVSDKMTVVSNESEMIGLEERLADNRSQSKGRGNEFKGPPPLIKIEEYLDFKKIF